MTAETRCAVVSGAASGMGSAVAERFVQEGWRVVGVDLTTDALPRGVVPLPLDVVDRAALERELPPAVGTSQLRVVVNAAGIYPPSTLADYTDAAFRRVFDVNVLGTLNVIAAAVPLLRAGGGGAIVNFASVDAFAVAPGQLLYSASKAAVVSLTRSLAIELAGAGIVVNAVAPGWVDTPGNAATGRMNDVARSIPLGRVADPSEVADWVWQLGRGSYVTGEMLVISGGSAIH